MESINTVSPVSHVQFDNYRLAYRTFGNGPAVLLAFHGFGQDGGVFSPLPSTSEQYTIYAIDLFFHGESQFPAGQVLTKVVWQSLIDALLGAHKVERFSLVGFSMGGRFALMTANQYAHRVEQLILIAPDGITKTFWYWLATSSPTGRWLFGVALRHLPALSQAGQVLVRIGLLHRVVLRFAQAALSTPVQRQQVYTSWLAFRGLTVDLPALSSLLSHSAVRVRFFIGHFDRIVPESYIRPLTTRLHGYELTVLRVGHNRLIEQVSSLL